MADDSMRRLKAQARREAKEAEKRRKLNAALQRADREDSNVRYCGEGGTPMSTRQWAEHIATFLKAIRAVPDRHDRFLKLRPKQDDDGWNVALGIYKLCDSRKLRQAATRLDECEAIGRSEARQSITFALKQAIPDAISRPRSEPIPARSPSFHTLAFDLLNIDYLPLPRMTWHLKPGQDGYDDPYFDDRDHQNLCNIVCELVPGTTVSDWRESTEGQRMALMQTALENRGTKSDGRTRLHVEDIDNFERVRSVDPADVAAILTDGVVEVAEDSVKTAIEQILHVSHHQLDRPDELDDIYTSNVKVNGSRRATAFMLKGPGIRKKVMTLALCGKNGDQLIRLFDAPAELFVIQFVGRIAEAVIKTVASHVDALHKRGKRAQFVIIDGQDTARLLFAYEKLPLKSKLRRKRPRR